jgi:heat shock protein HtpX
MWELIRANKRNSVMLMTLMAVMLMLVGLAIGLFVFGPQGALFGVLIAVGVWLVLTMVSFSSGDQILLAASGARPITRDVHPQLYNVVEEMKIAAGLPAMPKVYIINEPAPNAFATGRSPESASVAVTAGLLARLNRDELQGVIAHEISHILHRDILYVTLAGIMLGGIVLLSQIFMRGLFWGSMGGSRRRYSSGNQGGGQAQLVFLLVAILVAILAPIMAQLLYFALSRQREYLADAGAARLTRYPEGLASALEKIANDPAPQLTSVSDATAPLYIANPFKKKGRRTLSDLTSTHPPISKRIAILRGMSQGASYAEYDRAFKSVTHSKSIIPPTALKEPQVSLREGRPEPPDQGRQKKQVHQIGDIMRKVNRFVFLACPCGLNLKIPPNFRAPTVECPRCGRTLSVTASAADSNQ